MRGNDEKDFFFLSFREKKTLRYKKGMITKKKDIPGRSRTDDLLRVKQAS